MTGANKNLYRATKSFGIDTFSLGGGGSDMGVWDGQKFIITVCQQIAYFPILCVILLTPIKAYGRRIPGKVVGHFENPMEIRVPFAHHDRGSGQRNGLQILDLVFNNTRLVECGTIVYNAQLH